MYYNKSLSRFLISSILAFAILFNAFSIQVLAVSDGSIQTEDHNENITITTRIVNDTSNARVTGKSILMEYEIKVDNVVCCYVYHEVSFTYGITTNNEDIAQITSGKAYVSKLNTYSEYYPNRDSIYTTKSNGNPAKFNSTVKIYKKSNDKLYAKITNHTSCYASGKVK